MTAMFRQGDVLIVEVEAVPDGCKPIARDNGRVVLAYGEVTGHAHAIAERAVKFFGSDDERFLISAVPFTVRHEEHAPVKLPAGTFRVIRQVEYSPERIRQVAD